MPVRQMKLRFDAARPTTRVVPSLLVPEPPQSGKEMGEKGNKKAYGALTAEPLLGVAGLPPPSAAEAPPAAGGG